MPYAQQDSNRIPNRTNSSDIAIKIDKLIKAGLEKRNSEDKAVKISSIQDYDQALKLDPTNIEALYFKTGIQIETSENIDVAFKAIQLVGKNLGNYLRVASLKTIALGTAFGNFKDNSIEEEKADLLIIKNRDQAEAGIDYQIVGHSYRLTDDLENAKVYYKKAIELSSNTITSRISLGKIYLDQENYSKAIELLEQAVSVAKYNVDAFEHLADSYTNFGLQTRANNNFQLNSEAESYFKAAIKYYQELTKLTGEVYDDEASLHYKLNNYQLAIDTYSKCDLKLLDPYHCALFGQAYYRLAISDNKSSEYIPLLESARTTVTISRSKYKHAGFDKTIYDLDTRKFITGTFVIIDHLNIGLNALKHEVSHAIMHNSSLTAEEDKLEQINTDPKLKNYYSSFRFVIDKYFTAALVANSGRFTQDKPMVFGVVKKAASLVNSIPGAEFVINIVNKVAEMAYVVNRDNKDKYLLSELGYFEEAQRISKIVAIEVTLKKAAKITSDQAFSQDSFFKGLMTKFNNLKAKVCVDLTNTPEKILAFKDAAIMIKICQSGSVAGTINATPEEKFIAAIMLAEERLQWNEQAKEVKKLDAKVKKMNSDKKLLAMSPPPAAVNENATKSPIKTLQKFGSPGVNIADKAIDAFNDKAEFTLKFSEMAEKFPDLHLGGLANKFNNFAEMLGVDSAFDS